MDVQPPGPEAFSTAYPRSAIDDFVTSAAAEERSLEQAVTEARNRERRADAATAESQATARLLRSTLHDLRRELDERRRQVEVQVDGILTRAFDEAGSILAEACLAARIDTPPAPLGEPPRTAAPREPPLVVGPSGP